MSNKTAAKYVEQSKTLVCYVITVMAAVPCNEVQIFREKI